MKKYLFIVLLVGVWSCGTPYQPYSIAGGFSETQLDENIFRVRFNGNGYTSGARSSDFCLMRSAELCKNNGFKYFVIIDESRAYLNLNSKLRRRLIQLGVLQLLEIQYTEIQKVLLLVGKHTTFQSQVMKIQ